TPFGDGHDARREFQHSPSSRHQAHLGHEFLVLRARQTFRKQVCKHLVSRTVPNIHDTVLYLLPHEVVLDV
ncbi:hypothetical protein K523DRAFT_135025, partial [Schizophyllum commune Tattone D]